MTIVYQLWIVLKQDMEDQVLAQAIEEDKEPLSPDKKLLYDAALLHNHNKEFMVDF